MIGAGQLAIAILAGLAGDALRADRNGAGNRRRHVFHNGLIRSSGEVDE